MKMLETLVVSIIFVFVFIFAFMLYLNYQAQGSSSETAKALLEQSRLRFMGFYSLPEISCGLESAGSESVGSCVDLYKVMVFSNLTNVSNPNNAAFSNYYQLLLGYGVVKLKVFTDNPFEVTVYNDTVKSRQNMYKMTLPVLVYNDSSGIYNIGNLIFEIFY